MKNWFKDVKFSIFIHWGLYSVDGVLESWSFYHGHVTQEEYFYQANLIYKW